MKLSTKTQTILLILSISVILISLFPYTKKTTRSMPIEMETNWKTYNHNLENSHGFSISFPKDSAITETKDNDTKFTLRVEPKAKFFLDTKLVEINVQKVPLNKITELDIDKLSLKQKLLNNKSLISGVIPFKINGLLTYEIYTHNCEEMMSNCRKKSVYYVNNNGYLYEITTTYFTNERSEPFRDETLDKIISSMRFE